MKKPIINPLFALYHFGAFTNPKLKGKNVHFQSWQASPIQNFQHSYYRQILVSHIETATKNCLWIRRRVQHLSSFRAKKITWEHRGKSLARLATKPAVATDSSIILTFSAGQCQQNCCRRIIIWNKSTSLESWDFPQSPGKEGEDFESRENPYLSVRWMKQQNFKCKFPSRICHFCFTCFIKNSYLEILFKRKLN